MRFLEHTETPVWTLAQPDGCQLTESVRHSIQKNVANQRKKDPNVR